MAASFVALPSLTSPFSIPHSHTHPNSRISRQSPPRRPRHPACCIEDAESEYVHNIRPDAIDPYPAFIPQTIEYAIRVAQEATTNALMSGETHLQVELPMGRSRKHWYRMSPLDSWYAETSILAFHFAEHFKPFPIHIVLGRGPGVQHNVPWVRSVNRFSDIAKTGFVPGESDQDGPVVIVAGVPTRDLKLLERFAERVTNVDAFILLNCAIDAPLSTQIRPFTRVFTCRALDKLAVMQESMGGNWSVFIEIAVFEYEWVGDCESSWTPKQKAAEAFAYGRDAKRRGINGYFETPYAGCEAGFWPFMTVSSREVLPLDGKLLARQAREKAQKKARRGGKPFGFF